MSLLSRHVLRHAGAWLLLALLAVPLVLSGHRHEPLQAKADACALCAAVGSVASAALQAAPQLTLVLHASTLCQRMLHAPGDRAVITCPARGPPSPLPHSLA